ncbi:MAG: serine/threonine protein kinase [Planctomycetes bacterium]|nr:serine/threonine protein kinase [Planctomycetota bacterium]
MPTTAEGSAPPGDAPLLRGKSIAPLLRSHGFDFTDAGDEDSRRFGVNAMLGVGATASVYAAFDRNLNRDVAVKVMTRNAGSEAEDVRSFVDEARTTASLEHPNVLPVHEIDVSERGDVYFTMKRIDGRSLGELILRSQPGQRAARIASFNSLVPLFIAIGHALAYAHHRGVIHQDVKPENIMIGDFGEVLLVDWGSAVRADAPTQRLYGTPLYMAPEQVRQQRVDARTDVYCLGATLFHALTLRLPSWDNDPEGFWSKKRLGSIDAPTREERRTIPARLLAIALKAMAASPAGRYQTAEAMITDLERYQAGLAVSAHRDSLGERLARWHRRHARAIWSSVAAVAVIVVLGGLLYGERLTRIATWGSPIVVESFNDESWTRDWVVQGDMATADGALVDRAFGGSILIFRRRLAGDAAIEFDGEIPAGTQPGDLSVGWTRDVSPADDPYGTKRKDMYTLQFGAHGGSYSRIIAPDGHILAMSRVGSQAGRRYHVRAEILDRSLRLLVDGVVICTYSDPLRQLGGGWFHIYTYYPGKRIDDIKVYARGIPHLVKVTTTADQYADKGAYDDAIAEYRRFLDGEGATELAAEARYKWGICEYRRGNFDVATTIWEGIDREPWLGLTAVHRIDHWFAEGKHEQALSELSKCYEAGDVELRRQHAIGWNRQVTQLWPQVKMGRDPTPLRRCLEVRDQIMADDLLTVTQTAEALLTLNRFEDVIERFPYLIFSCADACDMSGHPERVLAMTDEPTVRCQALIGMGCPQRALDTYQKTARWAELLDLLGRSDEVVASGEVSPPSLFALGRYDQMSLGEIWLAREQGLTGKVHLIAAPYRDEAWAMMAQGRYADALARYGGHAALGMWPRHWFMLDAYIAGDLERAFALAEVPSGWEFRQAHFDFTHYVMVPFLRELAGDHRAFAVQRERFDHDYRYAHGQRPWYFAQYLTDGIDEAAFRRREVRQYLEANVLLATAVKRERAGDGTGAIACYTAYSALPIYQRVWELDPVIDRFVAWRLRVLEGR